MGDIMGFSGELVWKYFVTFLFHLAGFVLVMGSMFGVPGNSESVHFKFEKYLSAVIFLGFKGIPLFLGISIALYFFGKNDWARYLSIFSFALGILSVFLVWFLFYKK